MNKKLNTKQEKFAQQVVLNGGDKVEAYKSSGWSWKNYTEAALGVQANKAFNHPKIILRIIELQKIHSDVAREQFKADSAYVHKRLTEIDQLDILDIMQDDLSAFKPLSEWPKAWRTSISGIDINELFEFNDGEKELSGLVKKIKWPDKVRNLELLGKHVDVAAWKEKAEANVVVNNVMQVPTCTDISEWENASQKQQGDLLEK